MIATAAAVLLALHPWVHAPGVAAALAETSTASTLVTATPTPTPTPTPTRSPDATFTIVATGDVLLHMPVQADAKTAGGYDFSPELAPLDRWVQGADLALCHLEIPIVPPGVTPSGYPIFGAPAQIAADLRQQGWDGCSTASNHSVDRGFAGVTATLGALDAAGLGHVGTARTAVEAAQPQLYRLEREGQTITVAHLAVTYGTNGMPLDAGKPWSVALIDPPAIIAAATAARAAGADLVIVSMQSGSEYVTQPSAEQVRVDQLLADSGVVDLVVGHHVHVPQPMAHLTGGPRGEGMWVAYGLGNYISNQDSNCCSPKTDSGLLMTAHVVKPPDGPARVTGLEWTGITVDRLGHHKVYAMPEATAGIGTLSAAEVATRAGRVAQAVGVVAPDRLTPVTPTGPAPLVVARTAG
jgi:poly-gamma-glutamate capsule biosynthesis protein CapA/YwtB (metallophosphatase superfamily)